jgi:hypothetical protein
MQSNQELKRNINKAIKGSKKIVDGIKRCLTSSNPAKDMIMKVMKYHENEMRFHRTTLMILEAAEQNKPKSLLESLSKKRVEYMTIALELLPALVEAGIIPEQSYLDTCKEHKIDYDALQTGLVAYDE